jgi:acetyl esterase/lipase
LRVFGNLPFGRHLWQKLDLYAPVFPERPLPLRTPVPPALPVVLFFHGGPLRSRERRDYRFVAIALARLGCVVAVPDYRPHQGAQAPGFLEDCAAASGWVLKHIRSYGGDERAVFLLGHAIGAYHAAMLALDPLRLAPVGCGPESLAGWIGLAGVYEFSPLPAAPERGFFGSVSAASLPEPIRFVGPGAPPALLLHGARDRKAPARHSAVLATALREAGNGVETRIYPRIGHSGMLFACLPWLRWRGSVLADIAAFISACCVGEFAESGPAVSAPLSLRGGYPGQ